MKELISEDINFSTFDGLHTATLRRRWIGEIGVVSEFESESEQQSVRTK